MPLGFDLTQEQEAIRDLAHEFAEKEIRPVAEHCDEHEEMPWEVMKKAHALGLSPAAYFPEEYGGGGLDRISHLLIAEELHWGDAGIAVCIEATGLAAAAIFATGTEEQKRRYIPEFCDTSQLKIGAMGLTEPGSGSDALALQTTAQRVEGGYLLNGTKQFITNGGVADLHAIFATTDRAAGPAGIACFVVEKGTPGLKMGRKEKKMGVRASHTAQVILEDCLIPAENRLGGEPGEGGGGPGALGALLTLEATRPAVGIGSVGIARAAYEFALGYSQERQAFGKPISKQQAIAFKLADMAMQIDAARLLCYRAAWMAQQGIAFTRAEGSMAKCFSADMAMQVTTDAVQVLGGYGYIREYPVERWMRDAKVYQIWEGTAEIQRLVISRAILGERKAATVRS
ncbi:MAG: acyl-CoA dehydrogenase family protein [Candidatus Dormibacteria bacterium]